MECKGVGEKKKKKKKTRGSLICHVFFVAATSGNLCEVSLSPLPILFACGIYFILPLIYFILPVGFISYLYFLLFVCAEFH